jgi:hypothetical protein
MPTDRTLVRQRKKLIEQREIDRATDDAQHKWSMNLTRNEVRASIATDNVIQIIGGLRPQLHRYCARVVGSVVDGEDIVSVDASPGTTSGSLVH